MDKTVEATTIEIESNLRDQLIVTVLGAVAGMLASKAVERGYYSVKAHRVLASSKKTTK